MDHSYIQSSNVVHTNYTITIINLSPSSPPVLRKNPRIPLKNRRVHTIGCVQELDFLGLSIDLVDPKNKLDALRKIPSRNG